MEKESRIATQERGTKEAKYSEMLLLQRKPPVGKMQQTLENATRKKGGNTKEGWSLLSLPREKRSHS